ncbi:unnamed protein product [Rotaria sordida]|uniref:Uncharacterized protein n=1 Tax=Rotaria sordida TaxID=392033 RepID=A0A818ST97_9BILA|nr:unnamed protein product [Rotaria sordida]CAF3675087.1 unnamed protein product [Rotaria sordida]
MATNKSSSPHSYQIISSIKSSKLVSKSSESLSNIEHQSPQQSNKSTKMKKSLTVLNGFETKSIQTPQTSLNSTSVLRRRFSLFRIKRPQPQQPQQQQSSINDISNENSNVQALQQIIDQLRHDLKNKTDELENMRQHIEKKCTSISIPSNESIEQAMQLQTMLNGRLEEMLIENDFLKKSIQELEIFAQQQKCKL